MLLSTLLVFALPFVLGEEYVKFAVVIYRHGDRTIVQPYPTDPWRNESLWPVKFGELTNIGKKQHYELGKWLRKRYSHLLSEKYNPSEIYIRSTDVDRTLMSAQANLAGMYPPKGDSVWDTDLLWQPIPIHTVPEKDDEVLAMKKHCPAYKKALDDYMHSKEYKEKLSKYQDLMDYLTAYTGTKVRDLINIEYIYNTLYIEELYNFTLPNWTHTVYPDKMLEPAAHSFRVSTATPTLARLKVGPLLKQITDYLVAASDRPEGGDQLNVVVYSAHDDTIACVLNALGLYNDALPPYTATVFFELVHDSTTNSEFVQISYRNSTDIVEPLTLHVPYCGARCPLPRLLQLYHDLISGHWQKDCDAQILKTGSHFFGMAFFLGLGIIVLVYTAHKVYFAQVAKRFRLANQYVGVKQDSKPTPGPAEVTEQTA
ncbi:prostatic acid phosphatase [Plutella xylostella]|uniref:prostatic acid phosphatase n=1 Tax=Plutella xylostella TaxID=51655 RepID=UPI0020327BA7|nr:prostatic acid phosphatase [Plutella xylostella]